MKKRHGVFFGFAVLLITAIFTLAGCDNGNSGTTEEEFNAEDLAVNAKVISESANGAMLSFMATPDIKLFEEQIATAKANGFIWLTNISGLPIIEGSTSQFITGKANQLTTTGSPLGSGFTFNLETNANTTDTLRPGIGFGAMCYFTKDNLGETTYNALVGKLENLVIFEGDVHKGEWVTPPATALTDLGISVFTTYSGSPKDITSRISFGLNLAEETDGKIMFYYGAVMVDKAISDFSMEGISIMASDEPQPIWNDGTLDGKITAEWWIVKQ
jgi:hypothetical protein